MFSPLPFAWFLMHPFTVLVLRTTVRFLSLFPDSLPQLFLRCLLLVLTFRIVRLAFTFFRPLLITQYFALSFPFFLTSPMQRFSSVLIFLIHTACFHAFLQIVVLSVLRFLSPIIVSSHRTTSMSQLFPYGRQLISHSLRFRFRIVGFGISSCFRCFPAVYLGVSQAASLY